MKGRFQNLLKGIFLGSISSLIASQGTDASTYDLTKFKAKDDGQTEVKAKKDNSQKFILKFRSDDSYLIAGHRSHASHASHASHRSSSTSSGSTYSTPSSSYSSPASTSTPSSGTTSPRVNTSSKTTNSEYISTDDTSNSVKIINLGDRLLKKGMSGTDVSQLKKILIEKNFLIETSNDSDTLFNEETKEAVIAFQKSVGIGADGVVGSNTVYYLKQ